MNNNPFKYTDPLGLCDSANYPDCINPSYPVETAIATGVTGGAASEIQATINAGKVIATTATQSQTSSLTASTTESTEATATEGAAKRAGATADEIKKLLKEPNCLPNKGNLTKLSDYQMKQLAQQDGYNSVEKWKQSELDLNSKVDLYKDSQGNVYFMGKKGSNTEPQPINRKINR